MELIIEFVLELILEGTIELLPNKKIPKWIRYPLAGIITLFFLVAIGLIFLMGICVMKEMIMGGSIIIVIGIIMLIGFIRKFIEVKNKMKNNLGDKNEYNL